MGGVARPAHYDAAVELDPRVQASSWAHRIDGLPATATSLLAQLPELLDAAEGRATSILSVSPIDPRAVLRVADLAGRAGRAGPEILGAVRKGSAPGVVAALARVALEGGPTYVKLGQLIASTQGLVPSWVAEPFAGARDAVPPAPVRAVERTLRRSGVLEHVASWDREPLASASVAQVHRARLRDGREVVLKVRRPGIVSTVAADAAYLLPLLRLAETDDRVRVANLSGTVELMIRLFAQEADLRLEAANVVELALAFERAGAALQVPAPIPGLVTKRVMALEFVPGPSAADVETALTYGHAAEDLVQAAVVGTLHTTLVDGVFHGDLHLGNVLINEGGLALIDFGIVGRLEPGQRAALLQLLQAAFAEDRSAVLAALRAFGALPPDADVATLEAALPPPPTMEERMAMLQPEGRGMLRDRMTTLVRTLAASGFRVPPELTLFAKNLVYLSDAADRYAPDLSWIETVGDLVLTTVGSLADPSPTPPPDHLTP